MESWLISSLFHNASVLVRICLTCLSVFFTITNLKGMKSKKNKLCCFWCSLSTLLRVGDCSFFEILPSLSRGFAEVLQHSIILEKVILTANLLLFPGWWGEAWGDRNSSGLVRTERDHLWKDIPNVYCAYCHHCALNFPSYVWVTVMGAATIGW